MHLTTNIKAYSALAMVLGPILPSQAIDAAAAPTAATIVPLDSVLRRCDFSQSAVNPQVPRTGFGSGSGLIHTAGATVFAEVHFVNTDQPGSHYDVTLVQLPRPASAACGPADPGVASSGLDLDGSGRGTATVQDRIRPGATGVWVSVARPNPHSQNPIEYYNSEFVVPT